MKIRFLTTRAGEQIAQRLADRRNRWIRTNRISAIAFLVDGRATEEPAGFEVVDGIGVWRDQKNPSSAELVARLRSNVGRYRAEGDRAAFELRQVGLWDEIRRYGVEDVVRALLSASDDDKATWLDATQQRSPP